MINLKIFLNAFSFICNFFLIFIFTIKFSLYLLNAMYPKLINILIFYQMANLYCNQGCDLFIIAKALNLNLI